LTDIFDDKQTESTEPEYEPAPEVDPRQLNQAQQQVEDYNLCRLPALASTSTEVLQDIYTPDRDTQNEYDNYHALKDWTLTYTKNDEERNYLMLGGHLVTALEYNGLHLVAHAVNSEDKRFAALLRSHNFSQQRELRSTRQFIEGKEKKEQEKGLFSFMSKKEE